MQSKSKVSFSVCSRHVYKIADANTTCGFSSKFHGASVGYNNCKSKNAGFACSTAKSSRVMPSQLQAEAHKHFCTKLDDVECEHCVSCPQWMLQSNRHRKWFLWNVKHFAAKLFRVVNDSTMQSKKLRITQSRAELQMFD